MISVVCKIIIVIMMLELDSLSKNICSKPMSFEGYANPLYVGLISNSQFFLALRLGHKNTQKSI